MNRYWPQRFEDMASDPVPVSWINEPVPPTNVTTIVRGERRPLHAVLVESLNSTQALLARLERGGVTVPRPEQRETIRSLYVATRHQVKALIAALELEGLE